MSATVATGAIPWAGVGDSVPSPAGAPGPVAVGGVPVDPWAGTVVGTAGSDGLGDAGGWVPAGVGTPDVPGRVAVASGGWPGSVGRGVRDRGVVVGLPGVYGCSVAVGVCGGVVGVNVGIV